jgi:glucose/mannose-6-phosphate isomerase
MINLDEIEKNLTTEAENKVLQSVDNLPLQLKQSFNEALNLNFPSSYKKVKNVIIGGLGGSRFPALIIKELFKQELKLPLIINDDYLLPAFANKESLVILSSYSGTTEEVIAMAKQALIKKTKITGITAGGEIAEILRRKKLPVYIFNPLYNPSGQPRIGFGYAVGGLLGMFYKLGFLRIKKEDLIQAIEKLKSLSSFYQITVKKEKNLAKQLALNLYEKYPYLIVSEFLTGWGNAVANQINETAKNIAGFRVIPELNHHLMEGLKHPEKIKEILIFVFFFSNLYSNNIKKRFIITKEVVEKNNISTLWIELKGKNKIEQVFEAMALGSYTSMYLSFLYQENPAAIPYVDYFKKRLKEI